MSSFISYEKILNQITPSNKEMLKGAKEHWLQIAKPLYSLGLLEDTVSKLAAMKGSLSFSLKKKGLIIMCADNGVVAEGVTQTGQEVTAIVSKNFTYHETSACIMADYNNVDLFPIDIGMITDVEHVTFSNKLPFSGLPLSKVSYGTRNMVLEPAMTREETISAIETGIHAVKLLMEQGYDILATGEMGIGNTTTSSALCSVLLNQPIELVTGKGAGLSSTGLEKKISAIKTAIEKHTPNPNDPIDTLSKVGGLDIAGLVGVFLGGAAYQIPIVIDGFISAVSALIATRLNAYVMDYILPSHVSKEPAGSMVLEALCLKPLLTCQMCLGEGTGALAAMPLFDMAISVFQAMPSFDDITIAPYQPLT